MASMAVARIFMTAGLALLVVFIVWASVNAIFFGDQGGSSFVMFGLLWLVTGLPLLLAGSFISALRQRRSSVSIPDAKRR
jgi:hypothetical protein